MRLAIVFALTLCALSPAAAQDRVIQPDDPIFLPQLGMPDDKDEPETVQPPPAPPADPETVKAWEQAVVGKPVYGYRTGRLGQVVSLAVNGRGQPAAVVVRLDPDIDPRQSNLPVLWTWVRGQAEAPTLVLPWSAAQVRWLVRDRGTRSLPEER